MLFLKQPGTKKMKVIPVYLAVLTRFRQVSEIPHNFAHAPFFEMRRW